MSPGSTSTSDSTPDPSLEAKAWSPTLVASAVPRWTRCSANFRRVGSLDICLKVSETSCAWCPTTTTVHSKSSSSSDFKMCRAIGTPFTRCSGLGTVARIREPLPAARTIALMRRQKIVDSRRKIPFFHGGIGSKTLVAERQLGEEGSNLHCRDQNPMSCQLNDPRPSKRHRH